MTTPPEITFSQSARVCEDYVPAAREEYDMQKTLEQQRLNNLIHPPTYSMPTPDCTWQMTGGRLFLGGAALWNLPWGSIGWGGALALNPFSRSSCDTPTGHRPPHSPVRPAVVDPHTITPVPCTSCSTPAPSGTPLNGPELGQTQQGKPAEAFGGQPVQPFNPSSIRDEPGLLLFKDSETVAGNKKFDDTEAERDCLNGGKSSVPQHCRVDIFQVIPDIR